MDNTNRSWLLVVGMHRSGTSALAGVFGTLGFQRPLDNMRGRPDNPIHHESNALRRFNDKLLWTLGGTWNGPPAEVALDDQHEMLASRARAGARLVERSFPLSSPAVFKDPRNSLLLPFWLQVLPGRRAGALIWRAPGEVASSLNTRNGLPLEVGLELWEHYNRLALKNLVGEAVLVIRYEDALRSSSDELQKKLGELCSDLGWMLPTGEPSVGAALDPKLHRERDIDEINLTDSQVEIVKALEKLDGYHSPFEPPELPPRSRWSETILELQRRAECSALAYKRLDERRGLGLLVTLAKECKTDLEQLRDLRRRPTARESSR